MKLHLLLAAALSVGCHSNPVGPSGKQAGQGPASSGPQPVISGPVASGVGWSETFSGGLSGRWEVENYGRGVGDTLMLAGNVDLSHGALGLRLSQRAFGSGAESSGAEVQSVERYGFGVYTWVARMSSTSDTPDGPGTWVSGSTTGLFLYVADSLTEIDFESEMAKPNTLHCVTWNNSRVISGRSVGVGNLWEGFHTFSFAWLPQSVTYYVDGMQVAQETYGVPQTPAYILMNHWGTDNKEWGGRWNDQTRWVWIRSFSFEPR